ncbi:MAG: AAA family ATPase, partial [Verrucomicrobiota bacterium]
MPKGFFIAGTDTGVGKTWFTTSLLRLLRKTGADAIGIKPIECGGSDDGEAILAEMEGTGLTLDAVGPLILPEPLAPAAMDPVPEIDLAHLARHVHETAADHDLVLVE